MRTKAPAAQMEGTHKPTNTPASRSPANQRPTESRNDAKAAARKNALGFSHVGEETSLMTLALIELSPCSFCLDVESLTVIGQKGKSKSSKTFIL